MQFCNFLKKMFFLQIFENSPATGGSGPGPPTRLAITLNPPKFFPPTPLVITDDVGVGVAAQMDISLGTQLIEKAIAI